MNIKNRYILIVILLIAVTNLHAQDSSLFKWNRLQYGGFAHYVYNSQDADFKSFPWIPSCAPNYSSGSGYGFDFGGLIDYPIWGPLFAGGRLGLEIAKDKLIADESFLYVGNDVTVKKGLIEHEIDARFTNLFSQLFLGYRPSDGLIVSFGLRMNYTASGKFDRKESLLNPAYGSFENGQRVRNVISNAKIPNLTRFGIATELGLSYEIAVDEKKELRIAPEFFLTNPSYDLVKNLKWDNTAYRFGLAVKYAKTDDYPFTADIALAAPVKADGFEACGNSFVNFSKDSVLFNLNFLAPAGLKKWAVKVAVNNKEFFEQDGGSSQPAQIAIPIYDNLDLFSKNDKNYVYTLTAEDNQHKKVNISKTFDITKNTYMLKSAVDAYGVDSVGKKVALSNLTINRKIQADIHPLLNYVFFDEAGAFIPKRYKLVNKEMAYRFSENKIKASNTLDVYYNILNIIGKRMAADREAKITLVGCVSGMGKEKNNLELAKNRAISIKDYLMMIWKISDDRIKIAVNENNGGLPEKESLPGKENHFNESAEENRRVEIIPDKGFEKITEPVILADTSISVYPVTLCFMPTVTSNAGIARWEFSVTQNGNIISDYEGQDTLPKQINVELNSKNNIKYLDGQFEYKFEVFDKQQQYCKNSGDLSVNLKTIESSFYKFRLILFDFDSYRIDDRNQKIVDLIRHALKSNANVAISGYTDQLGEQNTNSLLSKYRAFSVAKSSLNDNFTDVKSILNDSDNPDVLKLANYDTDYLKDLSVSVEGYGESNLLYKNDTPEARFYCRTVMVNIENPPSE